MMFLENISDESSNTVGYIQQLTRAGSDSTAENPDLANTLVGSWEVAYMYSSPEDRYVFSNDGTGVARSGRDDETISTTYELIVGNTLVMADGNGRIDIRAQVIVKDEDTLFLLHESNTVEKLTRVGSN